VVVGARIQAARHVGYGLSRGKHEDRHPSGSLAKLAADIESVDIRQPDVQDDRIEVDSLAIQMALLPLAWISTA
jgi:hypothetical protein